MSSRQDSEPTSIIVLNSPGLRPWRKRQLNRETQKLAFGLQLRLAKGITKVVVQTHMHDSPLSSTGQGCNQNFLLRLLAPQDRSFRKQCRNSTNEAGHSKLQSCEMLGSQTEPASIIFPGTALREKGSFIEKCKKTLLLDSNSSWRGKAFTKA